MPGKTPNHHPSPASEPSRALNLLPFAVYLLGCAVAGISSHMFLDGVTYACVARNLAEGVGSFWRPSYTALFTPFREHPPLAMWLQSLGFRLVGDLPYLEFYWGCALGLVTLLVFQRLCGEMARSLGLDKHTARRLRWWGPLVLCMSPLYYWCFVNNMLEGPLALFVLAALFFGLRAVGSDTHRTRWILAVGSGAMLLAAVLTKGVAALFPLAIPVAAPLLGDRTSRKRLLSVSSVAAGTMIGGLLLLVAAGGTAASEFVDFYIGSQVMGSMAGVKEVAPDRWYIVRALAVELLVLAALPAALLLIWRARPLPEDGSRSALLRGARRCALIGLSATVPFLLFPKQMRWYIMPGLPFFATALAMLSLPAAARLSALPRRRILGRPVAAAVSATVLLAAAGVHLTARRTMDISVGVWLRDAWRSRVRGREPCPHCSEYSWRIFSSCIMAESPPIMPGTRINYTPAQLHDRFRITAYLQRWYGASLDNSAVSELVLCQIGHDCPCASRHRARRLYSLCRRPERPDVPTE